MLIRPVGGSGSGAFLSLTDYLNATYGGLGKRLLRIAEAEDGVEAVRPTIADMVNTLDYGVAGVNTTTTLAAELTAGATSATLTDASSWAVGNGIAFPGAGAAGAEFIATLTNVAGNVVSWTAPTAATIAAGSTVYHDDLAAILAAIATARDVYVAPVEHVIYGEIQLTNHNQRLRGARYNKATGADPGLYVSRIRQRNPASKTFLVNAHTVDLRNIFINYETPGTAGGYGVYIANVAAPNTVYYNTKMVDVSVEYAYAALYNRGSNGSFITCNFLRSAYANLHQVKSIIGQASTGDDVYFDCIFSTADPYYPYGAYLEGSDNNHFIACKFWGHRNAVYGRATSNQVLINTYFDNCSFEGAVSGSGYVIDIDGSSAYDSYGFQFINCETGVISGSGTTGGMRFGGYVSDFVVDGGIIFDPRRHGITIEGTGGMVNGVRIKDCSVGSSNVYSGIYVASTAQKIILTGNRVYGGAQKYGIEVASGATYLTIKNNILNGSTAPASIPASVWPTSEISGNQGIADYETSVAGTPVKIGRRALYDGLWYTAKGVSAASDWVADSGGGGGDADGGAFTDSPATGSEYDGGTFV